MILDELHVLERHPGAVGQCHAVAGLDRRVGGEREDAAGTAGRHDHSLAADRSHLAGAQFDGGNPLTTTVFEQ